jgi:toxin-antitoxin system PIN domain toxin
MILIDANVLIHAVNSDSPLHRKAKAWLEATLSGPDTVGLSWIVLLAFLRLTTRPGIFEKPLSVKTAFDVIDAWLELPSVVPVDPAGQHFRIMRDLLLPLGTGGNLTSDAHLAALAIEHGAELCSSDSDFDRFPRLRRRNPLT